MYICVRACSCLVPPPSDHVISHVCPVPPQIKTMSVVFKQGLAPNRKHRKGPAELLSPTQLSRNVKNFQTSINGKSELGTLKIPAASSQPNIFSSWNGLKLMTVLLRLRSAVSDVKKKKEKKLHNQILSSFMTWLDIRHFLSPLTFSGISVPAPSSLWALYCNRRHISLREKWLHFHADLLIFSDLIFLSFTFYMSWILVLYVWCNKKKKKCTLYCHCVQTINKWWKKSWVFTVTSLWVRKR